MCAKCLLRWFGDAPGKITQWYCRKNPKGSRGQLPVIGDDAALAKSTGCKDFKEFGA